VVVNSGRLNFVVGNVCRDCRHYLEFDRECRRYPPTPFLIVKDGHWATLSAYAPVTPDATACGEFALKT
jgi:hypothetical protein